MSEVAYVSFFVALSIFLTVLLFFVAFCLGYGVIFMGSKTYSMSMAKIKEHQNKHKDTEENNPFAR